MTTPAVDVASFKSVIDEINIDSIAEESNEANPDAVYTHGTAYKIDEYGNVVLTGTTTGEYSEIYNYSSYLKENFIGNSYTLSRAFKAGMYSSQVFKI